MAATVSVDGSTLTITCSGGRFTRNIDPARMQEPNYLESQIRAAINVAYGTANDTQAAELDVLMGAVGREADRLRRQGQRAEEPAQPTAPAQPSRPRRPRETPPRQPEERPPQEEEPEAAPELPAVPPRPDVSLDWIGSQLRDARGGRREDGSRATSALHMNREFVEAFLSTPENREAATIAVFDALSSTVPKFRAYLTAHCDAMERFTLLETYLADSERNPSGTLTGALAAAATPEERALILQAADAYIRYFLVLEAVSSEQDANYVQELMQLPSGQSIALENLRGLRTETTPQEEGPPTVRVLHPWFPSVTATEEDPRSRFVLSYLLEPIDADTVTAAALYIRRWSLTHPERGRPTDVEDIALWQAPPVTPLQAPEPQAEQPVEMGPRWVHEPTELEQFAQDNWTDLASRIAEAVQEGQPATVVTIMRDLPQDALTLEDALTRLNRNDIQQAFDIIFNDYLHADRESLSREFLRFLRSRDEYEGIASPSFRLTESSSAEDRALVVKALQEFLNSRRAANDKLSQDLDLLFTQVFPGTGTELETDGELDMRTLAALSIYVWRSTYPEAVVGEWGRSIGINPPQAEPVTPPTTQQQGDTERGRPLRVH